MLRPHRDCDDSGIRQSDDDANLRLHWSLDSWIVVNPSKVKRACEARRRVLLRKVRLGGDAGYGEG